jgi:hypothetical protein
MIGKHQCREVRDTDLRKAIAIAMDEALTALEESFHDLSDDQVRAFPIPGRNNIAWIVMHCLQGLDTYGVKFQTGKATFEHGWRWDLWQCKPEERPKPGDPFPSKQEMVDLAHRIAVGIEKALASATEQDLRGRRKADDWWQKSVADGCLRTVMNTAAHVRQIWLLRGALGLTDGKLWPQQHWA